MDTSKFYDKLYSMPARDFPTEWMAEAWGHSEIRANLTYGLSRMVSKIGELAHGADHLDLLARSLSNEQLVQLYIDIRDQSHRFEEEWREEFERAFPKIVSRLPEPYVFPEIDRFLKGEELHVGWARNAWEVDRAREFITSVMARDLEQGGMFWCEPSWLEHLDLCLTRDQLLRLYTEMRDISGRPEQEWRHVFEESFPDCVDHFPKPLDRPEGA
ncbi:hypothetical protein SAMN05444166_2802 [Singulisphaera sp. GP187]|nr:hypothetical protein SAMN05444166_2802 [Singulisphaera sp. GP187]